MNFRTQCCYRGPDSAGSLRSRRSTVAATRQGLSSRSSIPLSQPRCSGRRCWTLSRTADYRLAESSSIGMRRGSRQSALAPWWWWTTGFCRWPRGSSDDRFWISLIQSPATCRAAPISTRLRLLTIAQEYCADTGLGHPVCRRQIAPRVCSYCMLQSRRGWLD